MKRSGVKDFLKAGADYLNVPFGRGQITEFNSDQATKAPKVWQETKPAGSDLNQIQSTINNWEVVLHIAMKDKEDSSADQYEAIIDECDDLAQRLIIQYNQAVDGSSLIQVTSYKREPFIKKHAMVLTGVILSFTLIDPSNIDFCP